MYFPIKIWTTDSSYLRVSLSLPIFARFRTGFKPDEVIAKDSQITCMTGSEVSCLHFYILAIGFRIRNNRIIKVIKKGQEDKPVPRFLYHTFRGWQQVFESAII